MNKCFGLKPLASYLRARIGRKLARRAPRHKPCLETLEDRRTPTIVFRPQFGAETVHDNGGPVLNDVPVYLTFWGPQWGPSISKGAAKRIADDASTLFSSLYLEWGARQYNPGIGQAHLAGVAWDPTPLPDKPFSMGDIADVVDRMIDNNSIPDPYEKTPKELLFVVTPPGFLSDDATAASYHDCRVVTHFNPADPIELRYEGWIQHDGNFDDTTVFLSHELVEAVSNPNCNGGPFVPTSITVDHGASWAGKNDDNEIADAEAQSYSYRIGGPTGILAQSYWSAADATWDGVQGAYIVPDGTVKSFYVDPVLQGTMMVGGTLHVIGDQLQADTAEQIGIDVVAGGVQVTLNGETAWFDPVNTPITSIVVDAKGGLNTIHVYNTLASCPVTIQTGSYQDIVLIGDNGSMQGIQGAVNVVAPKNSGKSSLLLDDGADPNGQHIVVNAKSVTGLGATISFDPAHLNGLTILTGSGQNTTRVRDTPDGPFKPNTLLDTGIGTNAVSVWKTTGSLEIDGESGHADVTISMPVAGFVPVTGAIRGPVFVHGSAHLTIDDSGDSNSRVATIDGQGIETVLSNLAPAPIRWWATPNQTGGVSVVTILAGTAGNTFKVLYASKLHDPLFLSSGSGNDTVEVHGTLADLTINGFAGQDYVTLGNNNNVDDIQGQVQIINPAGSTQVIVHDEANLNSKKNVALTASTITGLSPGAVSFTPTVSATGGVTALSIFGGQGDDSYTLTNPSALEMPLTLNTGGGNDQVYVLSTQTPLNIDGAAGLNTVTLGAAAGNAAGTVVNLLGAVSIADTGGKSTLIVADQADVKPRSVSLFSGGISFLAPTTISYTPSQVSLVQVRGGNTVNNYSVTSSPLGTTTSITGGSQFDSFFVGSGADGLGNILGPVSVDGTSGGDALTVRDDGSSVQRFYTLTAGQVAASQQAAVGYNNVAKVTVKLTSGTDQVLVAVPLPSTPVAVQGGGGADTLVGPDLPNIWTVKGSNAGSLGNVSFTGVQNLTGGKDVDSFLLVGQGNLTGQLTGGGAPLGKGDWLDYSSYAVGVNVNLTGGSATGIQGGVLGLQNVVGSPFNDALVGGAAGSILIGGAGADKLSGGAGRNLLVGGAGGDNLVGGAADDILIGGTTTFDADKAALMSILREWQRTDKDYVHRISDLQIGGGFNGANKLLWGSTVMDDVFKDVLTGQLGQDWFFANPAIDQVTDRLITGPNQEKLD
jgi:hypothetical protein